ncbi:LysR family transcriptional regulator [Leucobacter sp. CSA2]|uniref:LysR family transcriptional regulator n=1 Tax=Leucobacter edaphi TaxID=2796472 RepID=A0A934QDP7_9MICO|nr:LysR family transcriptional regulator [Leucobacter edaphi]MBK0422741.1 LysR family transcriptional regulator [Leucobacter edaphi]
MISTVRLRVLREVADCGSFTSAAKNLHLVPSAVSHHISKLESELDTQLLVRGSRGLRLTSAGKKLVEYAERILALLDEAEAEVREISRGSTQRLSLGFFISAGLSLVPTALSEFMAAHPSAQLSIVPGQPDELLPQVVNAELDAAIIFGGAASPDSSLSAAYPLLEFRELQRDAHFLAIPPSYHHAGSGPVHLEDLADASWIATRGTETDSGIVDRLCAAAGFTPRVVCRTDYFDVALGMVAADLGFAIVPGMSLALSSVGPRNRVRLAPLVTPWPSSRSILLASLRGSENPLVPVIGDHLSRTAERLKAETDRLEARLTSQLGGRAE